MSEVLRMPGEIVQALNPPAVIMRPCDYSLLGAWWKLETQLGTIEAFNRLAMFANRIKEQIDRGDNIKAQNPLYATSTGSIAGGGK